MNNKMSLLGIREWAADEYRGYFGYAVHAVAGMMPDSIVFPAFTHEQMLECKRITEELGEEHSFDSFPHLVYDEETDTWNELYYEDMSDLEDVLEPFYVDGVKLYALGHASGWVWNEVSKN